MTAIPVAESLYRIGKRFVSEHVEFIGLRAIESRTARDVFTHLKNPEQHADLVVKKPLNVLQRLWISLRFRLAKTMRWFSELKPKLEKPVPASAPETAPLQSVSKTRPAFLPPPIKQQMQELPTTPIQEIITHNCGPVSAMGLFRLYEKEVSLGELQQAAQRVLHQIEKEKILTPEKIQKLGFYSPTGALSEIAMTTILQEMGLPVKRLNLAKPGEREALSALMHQGYPALFNSTVPGQEVSHCTLNMIRENTLWQMDPMEGTWQGLLGKHDIPAEAEYVTVVLKKPTYQGK